MLSGLSKQVAHCYFRASECRELAVLSLNPTDRQAYIERERAWLALARSYEFSQRLGQMLKEMQRQERRNSSRSRNVRTANKLRQCPTCNVEMQFRGALPVKGMFVHVMPIIERAFFLCPNCRRLVDRLAATACGDLGRACSPDENDLSA